MRMKLVKMKDGVKTAELHKSFESGSDLHDFLQGVGLTLDITDCIDDVMNREEVTYTVRDVEPVADQVGNAWRGR